MVTRQQAFAKSQKTESMLLSNKAKQNMLKNFKGEFDLYTHGEKLEVLNNTKYLDIQKNQNLIWKKHVKTISNKVSKAIGMIKESHISAIAVLSGGVPMQ